ncbi:MULTISPECIES: excisionase family DNA-binding protein [Streptomyces]|jgi:excisionase family DNA binding protein|uniref:excisionase family DNA-binding protein n=1 Tax=Streptomyces TaxID=1883 RepID=UPI000DEEF21C|nr:MULTISPECIES: excisionase family DNA-binding protein [unclassified Streptomyces]AXE87492.1 Helix-turn-helix domain protein [Streptomyces sp. Go-475]MZF84813.1 excisionase family DNA-binding protein [Streptomyces sp. SID5643]
MNDRYLSVDQVAELLGTTPRFPRRLIEERRIRYVKVGRHVRIPESAVEEFIRSRTVEPLRRPRRRYGRAA